MLRLDLAEMGQVDLHELEPRSEAEGRGIAVVLGSFASMSEMENGPLVRVHSSCFYGDTLGSIDCDCGPQLMDSQRRIAEEGQGILFYLMDQEGRGAGIETKARAYSLMQEEGLDTVEAYERLDVPPDQREYGHCSRFLIEHGILKTRLLTNNPRKTESLSGGGIDTIAVPLLTGLNQHNIGYLRSKRDRLGHQLPPEL